MKLIVLIRSLFFKGKGDASSSIADAISEGIKDTFKEMGYRFSENNNKI